MDIEMISSAVIDEKKVKCFTPEKLEEMKAALRKYRCELLEDLHDRQKRLDRIDLAIRKTEKELKKRKAVVPKK